MSNLRTKGPATLAAPSNLRKREKKANDKLSGGDDVSSERSAGKAKKRGRKREAWDKYVKDAQKKIAEFKKKLSTAKRDGIPVKMRQKWRNVVSAQQSRLKKKYEVKFLNQIIGTKDQGIEEFLDIVASTLKEANKPELLA